MKFPEAKDSLVEFGNMVAFQIVECVAGVAGCGFVSLYPIVVFERRPDSFFYGLEKFVDVLHCLIIPIETCTYRKRYLHLQAL